MNILFIHQNFPGQFKFLAPALAANPGAYSGGDDHANGQRRQLAGYQVGCVQCQTGHYTQCASVGERF
jgi:hypothetical protein